MGITTELKRRGIEIKKVLPIMLVFFLCLSLLSGCTDKAKEENTIKVGYFPNVTHATALVGFGEGRFQKELGSKVNIEEKIFVAGPSLMEGLLAGEVDIGYIGPIPAINGYVQGAQISIISGANNGGAVLIAGKNSGIESPEDLKGKKVAIPQFANTQDISLRHILGEYGLKEKAKGGNIEILQVAPADMGLLFGRNQIDAALVPEPWGTQLITDFGARMVLDWKEVWNNGQYPTTIMIARNDFIEEHPELVEKWLKVHKEIVEYIQAEPEQALTAVSDQLKKVSGKTLANNLLKNAMDKCMATTELDPKVVEEFATLSHEAGYLKTNPDLTALHSFLTAPK